jgi:hypothetical protein
MSRLFLAIALVASSPALAAPPEPGSEDYEQLMPYADWMTSQWSDDGGTLCCSISDCRVVQTRNSPDGDGYDAWIAELDDRGFKKFNRAPNAWLHVPASAMKHHFHNPTGRAIACWSWYHMQPGAKPESNGFYCFFPGVLT